eukprot:scaffold95012_cov59-Cyclotella_meneghiniana.AAC.2
MMKQFLSFLLLLAITAPTHTVAFVAPSTSLKSFTNTNKQHQHPSSSSSSQHKITSTTLSERQWNFNNGRSPFGLKKNAEIWNGRVAQMAFVIVLLQEVITGKGVVQSVQEGEVVGLLGVGLFGVSVAALTVFLISKGDESDVVF